MNIVRTKSDPVTKEWSLSDAVVQLREWGMDRVHGLPSAGACLIGTDDFAQVLQCPIRKPAHG